MELRKRLIEDRRLVGSDFRAYCNTRCLSRQHQIDLQHANVDIIHILNIKRGEADERIKKDLQQFKEKQESPATIVLLTGDIDFINHVNALRFSSPHYIILIYNPLANEKLLKTANEAYPFHIFVERCRKAINNARVREASPAKFKKENKNAKREDKRAIALTDTRDIGKNQNTVVETQDLFRCSMCTKTFPTNASRAQHEKDKHSVGLLAEVPSTVTNDFDPMQPSLLDTRDEVINRINLPDDDNNLNQASANLNDTLVASQMNDSPESQANFSGNDKPIINSKEKKLLAQSP
ncbi:unnamed protein product [Rotaria socialis]